PKMSGGGIDAAGTGCIGLADTRPHPSAAGQRLAFTKQSRIARAVGDTPNLDRLILHKHSMSVRRAAVVVAHAAVGDVVVQTGLPLIGMPAGGCPYAVAKIASRLG